MDPLFVFVECGEGGAHVGESEYAAYILCDELGLGADFDDSEGGVSIGELGELHQCSTFYDWDHDR